MCIVFKEAPGVSGTEVSSHFPSRLNLSLQPAVHLDMRHHLDHLDHRNHLESSLASQAAPAHVGHLPVPPGDQGQPHLSVKQFTWSRQHCHCSLHHPQLVFHLVHLPPSDWDFKNENAGRRLPSLHLQIPRINLDLDRTKGRDCKLKRFVEEAVHLVDYDLPAAIKPSSPDPS